MALLAQIARKPTLNNKLRKLECMLEIRRMIVEGNSHAEIQSKLNLPKRTYFRYLNATYDKDRQILSKVNENEVMTQAAILRDRYTDIYQTLDEISKDRTIHAEQRISACITRAQVSKNITRIYTEAPTFIAIQVRKKEQEATKQMMDRLEQGWRQQMVGGAANNDNDNDNDSKYDWRNTEYARNVSTEKDDDSE
jgi:hypothetical protein